MAREPNVADEAGRRRTSAGSGPVAAGGGAAPAIDPLAGGAPRGAPPTPSSPGGRGPGRGIGLRTRLALVLVALVGLTAAVLGLGASAFVESSLRDQRLAVALRQADYDLGTLLPDALGTPPSREALIASGVMDSFGDRAGSQAIADFADGDPVISAFALRGALDSLPAELRRIVEAGQVGYAWTTVAGRPSLVVGGRIDGGPTFWFVNDVAEIDQAVSQLRIALLVGALALVVLALLSASAVARGILRPVDTAARAASRMAAGDLAVRVPVRSRDELGALAAEFNRMADSLEATITRLAGAEADNRKFVADVAHELRTPLTALVAEASILREALDTLPPGTRRAGELLVGDIGRLRALVDDLLELSRFDAGAETLVRTPVDLAARVRALVQARLPAASLRLPAQPVVVETDPRRFDRILGNLLDNARTHAPDAPVSVGLQLLEDGDRGPGVLLTVADGGPGVAGHDLERLFRRFEKADPARPGGSGLGLAIAREHALLLGGSLTAAPNPGGGLQFRLALPVAERLPAGDAPVTGADHRGPRQESTPRSTP